MSQHFDLIVIGSGPAGRRAAVQAAKLKKSVLVVERGRRCGGVCVDTGTIPSKTLRETVLNLSGWRERGFYGPRTPERGRHHGQRNCAGVCTSHSITRSKCSNTS
jgi:pyruvate/2-oxoglutarate dehydrogenase complex dihydrolipoamide dehydrogenase (E3) component